MNLLGLELTYLITQIYQSIHGQQAAEFIDADMEIDLVICDWNMPNKTGLQLLQELRNAHNLIPFLMITARADESSVKDAIRSGVNGYIRKPFTANELKSKILQLVK